MSKTTGTPMPSMAVVHVPFGYLPDTLGGTEVYVAGLARELTDLEVSSSVIASGATDSKYLHDGINVTRLVPSSKLTLEAMYSDGDLSAAQKFGGELDLIRPQVVHFHAFTASASLAAMREAAQRGVPILLTYHTPTVTCLRGTMLRWGVVPCAGEMVVTTCSACSLHGRGIPKWIAFLVSRIPLPISRVVARATRSKFATVLGMRWLTSIRHEATRSALALCRFVISPCEWVSRVLIVNGVPESKVVLSRQGLSSVSASKEVDRKLAKTALGSSSSSTLRLVFFGRIHPTKGLHTVLRALAFRPNLAVSLTIYGASGDDHAYANQIAALARADSRVEIASPLPNTEVVAAIATYDAVVIPSEWLETGPLVVYEAFAAGVPILGADLGGIRELVTERVNGRLLPPGDAVAWAEAIAEIADNRELLATWRQNIPPLRTMREVALDMSRVYNDTVGLAALTMPLSTLPRP